MLTGIEEVDWASLGHAYGPADDVPELLRGLASADPAERETALDGMYGAVHHQGDVYDSTLACIPFLLELVADPAVQDRGCIVELLTSIGGIELDDEEELDELGSDEEEFIPAANYAMAAAAIAAGADVFLGLVSDPDPEVRLAAPCALASLHPEPARVLTLLRERLTVERDTEVRLALVAAVGRIALRHASLRAETVDWLDWLARAAQDPGLRLAALAQRARCAPGDIPDDVVPWVTGLLEEIRTSANRAASPGGERAATPTLIGQVRELLEEHAAGRPAPWTEELLRTLHAALDDRVDDRIALILAQLRSPDWGQRSDAIWLCGGLIRVWRGRYEEVVRLVGAQLQDPEPRLREAATSFLERLFELGAPAADALASRLAAGPGAAGPGATGPGSAGPGGSPRAAGQSPFVGRSGRDGALLALARAGDTRAVPLLARALEGAEVRRELLYAVDGLGPSAAMLAPLLRRRLAEVEFDERLYDRAAPLLYALAAVRGTQALPEVLRILREAPANRRDWVREAALRTLAAFGPAAREAVPDMRRLLAAESASVATAAARALWAAEGDRGDVLPALERWLRPGTPGADWCAAAQALGEIGPAAASAAPALRPGLVSRDLWVRVRSAAALWRVSGEASASLPVLLAAWEENRHARVDIAECLAEMGPAASQAQLVVLTELTRRRRHNAREGGSGTHGIHLDEKLLTLCRAALARMERGAF
ncbi:PBS lyase [Streptomyces sp. NPDC053513]|uniref:PBS lyase n=1 Tax=unclassified Streptomyces TaxID=2593676 RepID=UPI0037D578B8